ncbi:MAG: metallopeptidase family protein [Clostridiales bacterium]|nr:metallopeptidase family protein [Clostridiales bacterium]
MITIAEMEKMLDDIVSEFPKELFNELNGGIILLPEAMPNPAGINLYILGQYHRGGNLGRYISIYYGSFEKVYGYLDEKRLNEKLTHTLKHEFTHHLESLAGEKGLEVKDAEFLADYLKKNPVQE